jgi:hypothetical protein
MLLILATGTIWWFFGKDTTVMPAEYTPLPRIKLAILNGCGYPGIAQEVKDALLHAPDGNFDIISWRNVDRDMFIYDKTVIVMKHDEPDKYEALQEYTGIKHRIVSIDENAIEEFQIILGKDYKQFF